MKFSTLAAKAVVAVKSTPDAATSLKDRTLAHYHVLVEEVKAESARLTEEKSS